MYAQNIFCLISITQNKKIRVTYRNNKFQAQTEIITGSNEVFDLIINSGLPNKQLCIIINSKSVMT